MVMTWILPIVILNLIKGIVYVLSSSLLVCHHYPHRTIAIPVLPRGKQLTFSILSTWGDRHYVGLNGIEVFTDHGSPALITTVCHTPLPHTLTSIP